MGLVRRDDSWRVVHFHLVIGLVSSVSTFASPVLAKPQSYLAYQHASSVSWELFLTL